MNRHKNIKQEEDSYHCPTFSILCLYSMISMEDSEASLAFVLQEMLCKHRQQLQVLHVHSLPSQVFDGLQIILPVTLAAFIICVTSKLNKREKIRTVSGEAAASLQNVPLHSTQIFTNISVQGGRNVHFWGLVIFAFAFLFAFWLCSLLSLNWGYICLLLTQRSIVLQSQSAAQNLTSWVTSCVFSTVINELDMNDKYCNPIKIH